MTREIDLSIDNAFRQAKMTANDYLLASIDILESTLDKDKCNARDAIALAQVMATDFHTTIMGLKLQEIRDAL